MGSPFVAAIGDDQAMGATLLSSGLHMSGRIALYPGSFDPVTLGHMDILDRARTMFELVVVAVLENPGKTPLFEVAERVEMLRESIQGPGVEVMTFRGLTVDCARHVGATALIRGLRMISDFESEFQMALMNRRLAPAVSTVFLMTDFANIFVSSSILKESCRGGGDVDGLVPPIVLAGLRRRFGFAD